MTVMMTPTLGALAATLVDRHFAIRKDALTVGGLAAGDLASAYGTPLYVYDAAVMRQAYRTLKTALQGFADVYYSVKANPNPAVANIFVKEGAGLEIASGGEFQAALKAGASASDMLFAGPGKSESELETAIAAGLGEIHLECFEEITRVAQIAARHDTIQRVAIRVNPAKSAQGGAMRMGGKPAAFGFDEENLAGVVAAVRQHDSLHLSGVHLFAGTQILDADVLLTQWRHGLEIARGLVEDFGVGVETIDLGGGLGVPYHDGDGELDLAAVSTGVSELARWKAATPSLSSARVLVEPGRFLTASGGLYVMEVLASKTSRGERFLICNGGMHHHLAASGNLGQVFKKDYPLVAATKMADRAVSAASICGPLCTPLDTLGRKTPMPDLKSGDLIAVLQSGAYGLTASPNGFLSHPRPAEVLIEDGQHRRI